MAIDIDLETQLGFEIILKISSFILEEIECNDLVGETSFGFKSGILLIVCDLILLLDDMDDDDFFFESKLENDPNNDFLRFGFSVLVVSILF